MLYLQTTGKLKAWIDLLSRLIVLEYLVVLLVLLHIFLWLIITGMKESPECWGGIVHRWSHEGRLLGCVTSPESVTSLEGVTSLESVTSWDASLVTSVRHCDWLGTELLLTMLMLPSHCGIISSQMDLTRILLWEIKWYFNLGWGRSEDKSSPNTSFPKG